MFDIVSGFEYKLDNFAFIDETAFNSHFVGDSLASSTVESGWIGWPIGWNADFTTSISSSESDCSEFDKSNVVEFIFWELLGLVVALVGLELCRLELGEIVTLRNENGWLINFNGSYIGYGGRDKAVGGEPDINGPGGWGNGGNVVPAGGIDSDGCVVDVGGKLGGEK